eukprot:4470357-Amphidinium_carterae.1
MVVFDAPSHCGDHVVNRPEVSAARRNPKPDFRSKDSPLDSFDMFEALQVVKQLCTGLLLAVRPHNQHSNSHRQAIETKLDNCFSL